MTTKSTKLNVFFNEFVRGQQFSGILLIICAVFSLTLANSSYSKSYSLFWLQPLEFTSAFRFSIEQLINNGFMAVFFLLVGLEIKRELITGELSSFKKAAFPIAAAIGGMLVPALMYSLFNSNTSESAGWGIPMATDIAFALGVLAIGGKRVPLSLKVFLTALAVTDDLGAIVVIAVFYTAKLQWFYLIASLGITGVLFLLNKLKVNNLIAYLMPGIALWYCIEHSGIHSTIAGVLLALTIPYNKTGNNSPLHILEHTLHKPVNLIIMPLFALANTIIPLEGSINELLTTPISYGIICGLVLGKPVGIFLFSYLSVKFKISELPGDLQWKQIISAGILGGIGFTMSIFITLLAFSNNTLQSTAKVAILTGSLLAGVIGLVFLLTTLSRTK